MAGKTTTIPIIRTKLQRPPIVGDHVLRSRLLERLDQRRQRPLTLVTAPAGYGKSTLVSCWLESCDLPAAWLSLDETDNDLHLFLSNFLAAVQTIYSGAGKEIQTILNAPQLPPLSVLAGILINELDQIEQAFILTLDDYHVIHDKAIHDLLIEILKHPPRAMHLVLANRVDPPLPLASLRAKGEMTEIRVQDLRFSFEETAEYLQKMMGKTIDDSIVALLGKKTEGWVTGLHLAVLSLRHREDLSRVLTDLPNDNRYVMKYVVEEVLSRQLPNIQEYLLSTSILNRFCAPLCEAVCVPGAASGECELHGWEFIDWVEQTNLFVIPLDDKHRWFRYHHMFQELLKRHLKRRFSLDHIDTLHRKAGSWFADKGLIEEALHHFLAGGDTRAAARLIARHRHDIMNSEQWHRLDRWINMLPLNSIENDPEILLLKAWLCENWVRLKKMREYLNQIEPLANLAPSKASAEWESLRAEFDALSAFLQYIDGDGKQAVTLSLRSLENLLPQANRVRTWAQCILALGYQMTGKLKSAYDLVYNALKEEVPDGTSFHSRLFIILGFVHWIAADLTGLRQAAGQSLKLGQDSNLPESISISHYFLGITHYLRNELKDAVTELRAVVKEHYEVNTLNFAHSAFALALSYQAQGRPEAAREIVETVIGQALDSNSSELLQIAEAFRAELALRQGHIAEARKWVENYESHPFHPGYRFYVPQLTCAKVLLAQNTPESLRKAADLLSVLYDYYGSIYNTRYLIDVLILQALLYDAQGDDSIAFEKLSEALTLAEPGGFIRPFLDLGPPMFDLLNRLAKLKSDIGYIGKLLTAFRNEKIAGEPPEAPKSDPGHRDLRAPMDFMETLTKRELEITALLAQRLSNKEIAEKLFITRHGKTAHP